MATPETIQWEQQHLGESIAGDGHPLVIACLIMEMYPSYSAAYTLSPGSVFSHAVNNPAIRGTFASIRVALQFLKLAFEQGETQAIKFSHQIWLEWNKFNVPVCIKGTQQAKQLEHLFITKFKKWSNN